MKRTIAGLSLTLVAMMVAGASATAQSAPPNGVEATSAPLIRPHGVAYDASGNYYIADTDENLIREVSTAGIVTTVAGTGQQGYAGDGGPATAAILDSPQGVAVDSSGNIYIADTHNNVIREVTASTGDISTIAGTGVAGFSGDGSTATSAMLDYPTAVAVDSNGNVYIADTNNHRIREITGTTIHTVAGDGEQFFSGDGGSATSAGLDSPSGVAVDSSFNIYIGDTHNQRVRMVTFATGDISTIAGSGVEGYNGEGTATAVELARPRGVAVDNSGNVYFADSDNNMIRSIGGGNVTTIAGTGLEGFGGGNGAATSAWLDTPDAVAVSGTTVLFSDTENDVVRELNGGTINSAAALTSPTPNSVLTGPVVTFNWTAGAGATGYILCLGTTVGGCDIDSTGTTTAASVTFSGLPTNGETIYARLSTNFAPNSSTYADYVFTAATAAALISPAPNSTLAGRQVTFSWTAGSGASYILRLGTTPGANDIRGTGDTTATSVTFSPLPTNGETIYARLYTNFVAGQVHTDYVFTAATAASLTSPAPNSTLTGSNVTFNWTAGTGATSYDLRLGTTQGGNDIRGTGNIAGTSVTFAPLPINGETIYARLYTNYASGSAYTDYVLTAANEAQAALISPAPNSTLPSSNVTFTWSAGTGAVSYTLHLGTTVGGYDIRGTTTTSTSVNYAPLPTNGETIYVRLFTNYASGRAYTDYVVTAHTILLK